MAIMNMAWNSRWAYGGDNGTSASMQINFAPTMAVAQVSLSNADGDGLCGGGINQYRTRTTPGGADSDHNFSWNTNSALPSLAFDHLMTSVTAEIVVGGDGQSGVMTLVVWLWS